MIIAICSLKPAEASPAEVVPATLSALEDRKTLGLFDFRMSIFLRLAAEAEHLQWQSNKIIRRDIADLS